jgi:hypothetical protein
VFVSESFLFFLQFLVGCVALSPACFQALSFLFLFASAIGDEVVEVVLADCFFVLRDFSFEFFGVVGELLQEGVFLPLVVVGEDGLVLFGQLFDGLFLLQPFL